MSIINGSATDEFTFRNELRRRGTWTDVTIRTCLDDRFFPCHRIVLASTIEYFRNKFAEEAAGCAKDVIELQDVHAVDFELLLQRVYSGSVKLNHGDNAYRLLRVSHQVHLDGLPDLYAYYLANIHSIPLDTVVWMYKFMQGHEENAFMSNLTQYLAMNFPLANDSEENAIFDLSASELLTIFKQPTLDAVSHVDKLDFVNRWGNCQSEGSVNHKSILKLLDFIDLNAVPREMVNRILASKMGVINYYEGSSGSSSGVESETRSCLDVTADTTNVLDTGSPCESPCSVNDTPVTHSVC